MGECMKCKLLKRTIVLSLSTILTVSPININFGDFDVGVINVLAEEINLAQNLDSHDCTYPFDSDIGLQNSTGDNFLEVKADVDNEPVFSVEGLPKTTKPLEYFGDRIVLDVSLPPGRDVHFGVEGDMKKLDNYIIDCDVKDQFHKTITIDTSFVENTEPDVFYRVSCLSDDETGKDVISGKYYKSFQIYRCVCGYKDTFKCGSLLTGDLGGIISNNKNNHIKLYLGIDPCNVSAIYPTNSSSSDYKVSHLGNGVYDVQLSATSSTFNRKITLYVRVVCAEAAGIKSAYIPVGYGGFDGATTVASGSTELSYDALFPNPVNMTVYYKTNDTSYPEQNIGLYRMYLDDIDITDIVAIGDKSINIPDTFLKTLKNGRYKIHTIADSGSVLITILTVTNSQVKDIISVTVNDDVIRDYNVNEHFNNSGTISVTYEDGSVELVDLSKSIIKDFDTSTVGNSTVTLSYNNFDFNYEITVNKTLESISFSGVKQEYTIGDEVDKTGKYILHYSDGTTEEHDIPVDKFDGITTDAEKTYTLIIEQDGVSGQIEISVNRPNKVASSIAVTGVTKNYEIDDIFDGKGKIVISYTDGTTSEVELLENMISGFDTSEACLVTVTVTYNGLTTTFDINVKEASGGTQPPTEESKPPVALTTLTYEFYKDYPDDVIIPLQMNDATDVTVVKVGSETLTENDYELVDSAIVLKKEFLENLEEAKHWVRLTFNDKANTVVSNIILQVYDELGSSEKPVLLYKRIVYDGNQFELPFVSGTGDYEAHDVDALIVDGTIYLPNGLEMPYSKSIVNEIALMRTYIEEDNDILYNDYEEDIIDEDDEYYEAATPSNAIRVATASNAVKKSNSNTKRLTSRQQDIVDALTVDDSGRVFNVENDTIIVDNDWFESLGIEEDNNYLLGAVFSNNDKTVDDKKVVISVPKGYDNSGSGDGEQKPPTGDGEQKPPTGDGSDGEQKPPIGGDEGTEKPPTGGDEGTEKPPTGGDEGTEKPPTGGDGSGTEKPPTGDGSETEKPPTGDGGNQGTTKPPTGEGDGSTIKPPTGDGNGSTGNPPIDDGNDGTAKPPTGGGSTNPPSGGNNSGTNTDGNNGGQNSGSNTPNRRPSHSSGGSGGSSSSTSNKTPTSPAVNSDGSLNTGYRPSVPNNGGTFVLDTNGNKVYKFPDGSIPLSTWVGDGKNWYYQNKDGFIETGWFLDNDGSWYMLCKEEGDNYGAMLCGWYFEIADGKWYFLNPADGRMLIGWQHINNKWYYLNEKADEQTYFGDNVNGWFYNSAARPFGSMWCNEITPDGYKVDSNGEWMK